jgi:hypothetical protein
MSQCNAADIDIPLIKVNLMTVPNKSLYAILFGLVIAFRPETPKHIKGGWSQYTDTSEPFFWLLGQIMWSLTNPGFKPAILRSLKPNAQKRREQVPTTLSA